MRIGVALAKYKTEKLSAQRRGEATYRSLALLFESAIDQPIDRLSLDAIVELRGRMAEGGPVHADRAIGYAIPFLNRAATSRQVKVVPDLELLRPK
jgi:hypothetical protein